MIRRVFGEQELEQVRRLLADAERVVSMRTIYEGERAPNVIGLRHDVDDNHGSLATAVKIAKWEHEHGFRSTYFILHTARYFGLERDLELCDALDTIAGYGHEIGIHADAIAAALVTNALPHTILERALVRLRGYGHEIVGVAAHGNRLCYHSGFVNDEQFTECARPDQGEPDRWLAFGDVRLKLDPRPLADFGLLYDTHRLPHGRYLSDSGGKWNEPFPGNGSGQLHVLWHPDWWAGAFPTLQPVEA